MGYHKRAIKKGILGTISKVEEEVEEFKESEEQGISIMSMVELSDIYGALKHLALKYNLSMDDLRKMSDATESAFKDGTR